MTHNSSASAVESTVDVYLQALVLTLILLIGLGLNLTVIFTYMCSKPMRQHKHNVVIIHLMFCDMLCLLWVMPVTIADVFCPLGVVCIAELREGVLCKMTGFLTVFQSTLSSLTLAAIAADRYVAVLHPVDYSRVLRSKCVVLLASCWMWASLTALPPLFPDYTSVEYHFEPGTKHCSPSFRTTCWFYWYAVAMGFGIPLPVMVFCYCRVATVLRHRKRKVCVVSGPANVHETGEDRNCAQSKGGSLGNHRVTTSVMYVSETFKSYNKDPTTNVISVKKTPINNMDKQVARRGALLITAYFLCWGPYALIHACPVHVQVPGSGEVVAMCLVFSLTVINPIIYVFNNSLFRTELKRGCCRLTAR